MKITISASRLDNILPTIREQHPYLAKKEISVGISLVRIVSEMLDATPESEIRDLAFRLNLKQILACLEILCSDQSDSILDKAYQVLSLRPKRQVMLKGWFKLVMNYPNFLLERAIREIAAVKGFDVFESDIRISKNISNWFVNENLVQGILRDYRQRTEFDNLDGYLAENMINASGGLFVSIWRFLLMNGSPKELEREPERLIIREFEDLKNIEYLKGFSAHYLNALQKRENWHESILLLIQGRYGLPHSTDKNYDLETEFWNRVQPAARAEFKQWYILYNIESFFEGERAEFWKQYVKEGKVFDVKKILHGDGFLLDFGLFGVVEFKQVGNASYIYPKDIFQGYWKKSDYANVWQLKNKEETIRSVRFRYWDGRIIHKRNWKSDTSQKISALLEGQ
jgi:uncharacterized protein (DUF1330 family)